METKIAKPSYEDLLKKVNEQDLEIETILENLSIRDAVFNEVQKIVKTSAVLIYSLRKNTDGSLCFPYVSSDIKAIYGFNISEIQNDINKILELIHPEDVQNVLDSIHRSKTDLLPLTIEYRYGHPTKGQIWHEMNSLAAVEPNGTIINHGIITDITQRVEAEQKMNKTKRLYLFVSGRQ